MVIHELKLSLDNDNGDKGGYNFEDFEIYKMVFDSTLLITTSNEHDEKVNGLENSYIDKFVVEQVLEAVAETELISSGFENEFSNVCIQNQLVQKKISHTDIDDLGVEKILEGSIHAESRNDVKISDTKNMKELYEELDRYEDCVQEIEMNSDSDKGSEELSKVKQMILLEKVGKGSKEEKVGVNLSDHGKVSGILGRSRSWRSNSSTILSSHGSMKEEKEWRRTLACKLFEERHNSRGGEEEKYK
nr:neurogenic differentiation factor 1 like [Tanacetum cinerariifolium]